MKRRNFSSAAVAIAAFVAVSSVWTSVHADEPDAARLTARALAEKGDLAFGSGRCDKAIPIWRDADRTFPAPTLKLRIAHCDALLGKVVEAAAQLQAIVDTQLAADAPQPWIDAKKQAETELPATRSRIAKIDVDQKTTTPITKVSVDDSPRPVDGHGFLLDPGHHRIELATATASSDHAVDLVDGDSKTLTARTYLEPAPEPPHTGRTLGYTFGAAGAASLVTGAIFGIISLDVSNNLSKDCPSRATCSESESSRISQVKTDAVLSDVFLGAGVVLAGVGTYFFVKDLKMEKPPPIPRLTITGSRLVLDGNF